MYARRKNISMHAEMHALFNLIKANNQNRFSPRNRNSVGKIKCIYVARLMNIETDDSPFPVLLGNSKPCENCQNKLKMYGISKVKYTDIIDGVNVLCEIKLT